MVGIGVVLLALAAWQAWVYWFHRTIPDTAWFLVPAALAGVAAVAAMEFGWIVTEVGRQPWIVYRILRTSDAVTPSGGVPVTRVVTLALYAVLSGVCVGVPWLIGRRWRQEEPDREDDETGPYGPPPEIRTTPALR